MYTRGVDFVRSVTLYEPYATVIGYILSVLSSYILLAGVVGGRLLTRRWPVYLWAAFGLASIFVSGVALYWGVINPAPGLADYLYGR